MSAEKRAQPGSPVRLPIGDCRADRELGLRSLTKAIPVETRQETRSGSEDASFSRRGQGRERWLRLAGSVPHVKGSSDTAAARLGSGQKTREQMFLACRVAAGSDDEAAFLAVPHGHLVHQAERMCRTSTFS
jgi:hypothetical protein